MERKLKIRKRNILRPTNQAVRIGINLVEFRISLKWFGEIFFSFTLPFQEWCILGFVCIWTTRLFVQENVANIGDVVSPKEFYGNVYSRKNRRFRNLGIFF